MKLFNSKVSKDRPSAQTPYGLLYSDTDDYARYAEVLRIRAWLKDFLDDTDHLRIDGKEALKRIDAFVLTLQPEHASLNTDHLASIRACLSGNVEIRLSQRLSALRMHLSQHWDYVVGCCGQACASVPTGQEIAYTGPFPREAGSQVPAYGYHRAMADGRR